MSILIVSAAKIAARFLMYDYFMDASYYRVKDQNTI